MSIYKICEFNLIIEFATIIEIIIIIAVPTDLMKHLTFVRMQIRKGDAGQRIVAVEILPNASLEEFLSCRSGWFSGC